VSADDLYHEALVRMARAATGAGRLAAADASATVDNPLCGDEVTMDVRLAGGRIEALGHRVRGCLLCEAAASLLGRTAVGVAPGEVAAARERLVAMLQAGAAPPDGAWAGLAAFGPVRSVPSRQRCVLLPFDALEEALLRARAKGS
jgi:nitrogen fixation NifU-like protein